MCTGLAERLHGDAGRSGVPRIWMPRLLDAGLAKPPSRTPGLSITAYPSLCPRRLALNWMLIVSSTQGSALCLSLLQCQFTESNLSSRSNSTESWCSMGQSFLLEATWCVFVLRSTSSRSAWFGICSMWRHDANAALKRTTRCSGLNPCRGKQCLLPARLANIFHLEQQLEVKTQPCSTDKVSLLCSHDPV